MSTFLDLLPPGSLLDQEKTASRFLVLVAPHAASQAMLAFAARLAQRGPVCVLDGGNRFNAYHVARILRSLGQVDLAQALGRIQVARGFTCYQMTALIEETPPQGVPTLVIDLLDTFYDESAPLPERHRLAQRCAARLRRLGQQAPVVASLRPPPPPHNDPSGLLDIIREAADLAWFQETPAPVEAPRLF
jgi:hypothetical protein